MNSNEVSKLFPAGTLIVAYKGETLGGTKLMPQWEIEPIINENRFFKSSDRLFAKVAVSNAISLEFEAVNPQHLTVADDLYSQPKFDPSPGELVFIPLDPEGKISYYFPRAELKTCSSSKKNKAVRWKFEIFFDSNGVFMEKLKTS